MDRISALNTYTGIPFGPSGLWNDQRTIVWGPGPFTSSTNSTTASGIVRHIDAARAMNQKLILNLTGGSHERYKTAGKFDLAKWTAVMNTYDTPEIKAAVAAAVADGTVILNNVMDEPNISDWGGVMTKPLLDQMARYVNDMFPTLPTGVTHRWDWRREERYQVMDALFSQYTWRKGDVIAFRDSVLATTQRDGMAVVFSLNILGGGIMSWTTKACPIPLTGGHGPYVPVCRMTADQVRDWGRILGSAGCAMSLWMYNADFMAKPENQQAFEDVAATLATIPGRPCRRGGGSAPPTNTPPRAAFDVPSCTIGVACQFTDNSSDVDGSITTRGWEFGNGETSSETNPSTTFAAEGAYTVTLTVTDDAGATNSISKSVTVGLTEPPPEPEPPPTSSIALSVTTRTDATKQYMTLKWTGASGTTVSVYRNGPLLTNTANDGVYTNSRTFQGAATYVYKVCQVGTSVCSNEATAVFGGGSPPPPNVPPTANFTSSCNGFTCNFADRSTDDGSVTGWNWDFGDNGGSSSVSDPSYTYAAAGSYDVTLVATDNSATTGSVTQTVTVTPPLPNVPPTANFTSSCSGLTCDFTDASTDDGSLTAWNWDFGDNSGSSSVPDPSYTYAAAGSYDVTLVATDNSVETGSVTQTVTVTALPPPPPPLPISLTVSGRTDATKQYMTLRWSGASGATVGVYRNGPFLTSTANDGVYTNSRNFRGPATYTYKVCQAGTAICSNEATVVFQ